MNAPGIPTKLPVTGIACRMSRATATGIRLNPPTLRFVGSKVIQPAPGYRLPPRRGSTRYLQTQQCPEGGQTATFSHKIPVSPASVLTLAER